jgi:hypothetical protein
MVLHFSGLAVSITIFLLPIVNFPLEAIVGLLHLNDNLFVLVDFNLVILIIVYLTIELELLLLELRKFFIAVLQQIIKLF